MMTVSFSTERLDHDPEFRRLMVEFSDAKMNLVSYLESHIGLVLSAEEKAGEVNPQP